MEYLRNIRWIRVIVASIIAFGLSYLILLLTTASYAFILAFQVRGKPDQAAIGSFAESVSRWLMPLSEIIFTVILTFISSKKIEKNLPGNGLLIGAFAGVFWLILKLGYGGAVTALSVAMFLIMSICGWFSGSIIQKRKYSKLNSPV